MMMRWTCRIAGTLFCRRRADLRLLMAIAMSWFGRRGADEQAEHPYEKRRSQRCSARQRANII